MSEILLRATEINKSFGKRKVLSDLTFTIESSEMIAIKGPSGSGKTTFLQVLSGILTPDSGYIEFDGNDYSRMINKELFRRNNFGFVLQNPHLVETMSVMDNILLPSLFSDRFDANQARHLIEFAGLQDLAGTLIPLLSEGEKQRCAICRSLINKPRILFADEPTGFLDRESTHRTIQFLKTLSKEQGVSCIVVTHDNSIDQYFDQIFSLA